MYHHRNTNISSVLVKGSASALNALSSIEASGDTLDVTDAQEDIVTTVDITEFLPEGISLVNAEDASITVTIKIKTISTRTINISTDNIEVKGLASDYELKFSSAVLAITVTGDDIGQRLVIIKSNVLKLIKKYEINEIIFEDI